MVFLVNWSAGFWWGMNSACDSDLCGVHFLIAVVNLLLLNDQWTCISTYINFIFFSRVISHLAVDQWTMICLALLHECLAYTRVLAHGRYVAICDIWSGTRSVTWLADLVLIKLATRRDYYFVSLSYIVITTSQNILTLEPTCYATFFFMSLVDKPFLIPVCDPCSPG